MHPLEQLSGSLSYFLCFTIYISLRHNHKCTLPEVIGYHYRFLSSKALVLGTRNRSRGLRFYIMGCGPCVPGPDPGSLVLILDYALKTRAILDTITTFKNIEGTTIQVSISVCFQKDLFSQQKKTT